AGAGGPRRSSVRARPRGIRALSPCGPGVRGSGRAGFTIEMLAERRGQGGDAEPAVDEQVAVPAAQMPGVRAEQLMGVWLFDEHGALVQVASHAGGCAAR